MYYIDWFKTVIDELQRYEMKDGSSSANQDGHGFFNLQFKLNMDKVWYIENTFLADTQTIIYLGMFIWLSL